MGFTRTDYERPREVLEDEALARYQKYRLLTRWAYDELRLMSSSDEGMDGGDSACLHEVMEALREVTPSNVDDSEINPLRNTP